MTSKLLDAIDLIASARNFANLILMAADGISDKQEGAAWAVAADAIMDKLDAAKELLHGEQAKPGSDNDD